MYNEDIEYRGGNINIMGVSNRVGKGTKVEVNKSNND